MRALLIRHAQTSGQAPDAQLTDLGHAQAEALAQVLLGMGAGPLYASPFRRALATIEPYAVKTGQLVTPLDGLRERVLAPEPLEDWMGHVERSFSDSSYGLEGGESFADLIGRAEQDLAQVAAKGGPLPVMVAHGNLMAALFQKSDVEFGIEDWQALRNPDAFDVQIKAGAIVAFERLSLAFSS